METIQLTIPGMKSPHCMMVVNKALKEVKGATIQKISPMQLQVTLNNIGKDAVVTAIERAGYQVENK